VARSEVMAATRDTAIPPQGSVQRAPNFQKFKPPPLRVSGEAKCASGSTVLSMPGRRANVPRDPPSNELC